MAEGKKVVKWVGIGCAIALGVGLLIGLSCVGVCGACAGGVYYASEPPAQTTQDFLSDLRANRIDAAYARMSPTYRANNDLEAFRRVVAAQPVLTQQTGASFPNRSFNAGQRSTAVLGGTLTLPSGSEQIEVRLSQQNDLWVIDAVNVGGQRL